MPNLGVHVNKRATFICVMHRARGMGKRFTIHVPEEWALEIIPKEEWQNLKRLEEP